MKTFTFISLFLISIFGISQIHEPDYLNTSDGTLTPQYTRFTQIEESPAILQLKEFQSQIKSATSNINSRLTKKAMDSIILVRYGSNQKPTKLEFEYDYNGNQTKSFEYLKDTVNNVWNLNVKSAWSFTTSNLLSLYIFEYLSNSSSQWIGYSNMSYSYNGHSDITQVIGKAWDLSISQWVNGNQYDYDYNSNNDLVKLSTKKWNSSTNLWDEVHKEELSYNGTNLILVIESTWDSVSNSLVNATRKEYTYDVQDNLGSIRLSNWSTSLSQWVFIDYREFLYDNNGNTTFFKLSLWDSINQQWVNDLKWDIAFDNNSLITAEARSDFNLNSNTWLKGIKYEYSYNNLEYSGYTIYKGAILTNQWRESSKFEISRNSADLIIGYFNSKYDTLTNNWKLVYENMMNYDINQNVILDEINLLDESLDVWVGVNKLEFSYDANNNMTLFIRGLWSVTDTIWKDYIKTEQIFSNLNDPLERMDYLWDDQNSIWINVNRNVATVDESFTKNELLLPANRGYGYNTMVLTENFDVWDNGSSSWKDHTDFTYYYSNQNVNSVSEIKLNSLTAYPNPFMNTISFRLDNMSNSFLLEVFDMHGKMMLTKQITSNQVVNTEHLSKGLYLYSIIIDNEVYKGKIIKQ